MSSTLLLGKLALITGKYCYKVLREFRALFNCEFICYVTFLFLNFIIGAGGGIGRAAAVRFAQEGATVIVTDRNFENATKTAKKLGGNFHFSPASSCY